MTALTTEELSFFKHYGYLLKSNAIPTSLCQRLVDRMWASAPAHLDRDNPKTWTKISSENASTDPLLVHQGARWQLRSASTEQLLIDAAWHPTIVGWAEQLLGDGTLRKHTVGGKPMGSWGTAWPGGPVDPQLGEGVRGIYATLPLGDEPSPDALHTDGHPFHLGVVLLLEDSPPNGGAFKIWPGSHRRFYPLFPMQYDQARIPFYEHLPSFKGLIHPKEYLEEVRAVEADTDPVDCHGKAGDLVFWHHRMGHMAGHNTALPPCIRQAMLYDFCKTDLDTMRLTPPHEDMWQDWGQALQNADAPVSNTLKQAQRLT